MWFRCLDMKKKKHLLKNAVRMCTKGTCFLRLDLSVIVCLVLWGNRNFSPQWLFIFGYQSYNINLYFCEQEKELNYKLSPINFPQSVYLQSIVVTNQNEKREIETFLHKTVVELFFRSNHKRELYKNTLLTIRCQEI